MAIILALEKLYDDVVTQFGVDGTFGVTPDPVTAAQRANAFGWREPARQGGPVARIVWVPGDDGSGALGTLGAPKYPNRTDPGRPLATLEELFTVWISSADTGALQSNERAQYHSTRLLYDAWVRAVYLNAHGTYRILAQQWVIAGAGVPRAAHRFGTAIRVTGAIQAMIPDATPTLVEPPLSASITAEELSQTDPPVTIGPVAAVAPPEIDAP
jgi:hypothetical protein